MSSVADGQLRAFVERILRMKEEQDALAADIRDIYAEAKSNGYDKTAMGALVTELRKQGKDSAKFEENAAILDLYREAYERAIGTQVATQAHAPEKADREARRRQRFSESMDDTADLSRQAVELGLIDPEAHAETVRLTSALADKFGAGPVASAVSPRSFVKKLRPYCQNIDECAGYGYKHCHTCMKAVEGHAA